MEFYDGEGWCERAVNNIGQGKVTCIDCPPKYKDRCRFHVEIVSKDPVLPGPIHQRHPKAHAGTV